MGPVIRHPYKGGVDWAVMRWMDIEDATHKGRVYLRRLIVFKTPWASLYVHWIYVPDGDRDPHNHPMDFWSWVVKGGYLEEREHRDRPPLPLQPPGVRRTTDRWRKRWSIARTTRLDYHSIISLDATPTVTVLFCGRRRQDWGFLTSNGYVGWRDYNNEKAAP